MKAGLWSLLRWIGVERLWRRAHSDAVTILTVHGVMDDAEPSAWVPLRQRLSPRALDRCLALLTRHYRFVSLSEAVDMLAGRRPLLPNSMVLTFDDGYRNQITHALPVLRKHKVPATIFVSTGIVETQQPFWFDRLDYALQQARVDGAEVQLGSSGTTIHARTREELAASYAELRDRARRAERDDRETSGELHALAARFEGESRRRLADIFADDSWSAVLTVDGIRRAKDEVSFGSHTVDHLRINKLADEAAIDQLVRSKSAIEEWTGGECRFFCYPDGGASAHAARLVTGCGYHAAVTTDRGLNYPGDDPMLLRRMDLTPRDSDAQLLASVSGLSDRLRVFASRRTR